MDFKDSIKQVADRVLTLKDNLQTEEATKNALIMPFITALGYDVFNPLEVVPEMTCDVGTKKGEKIDYAIMKDGEPVMLMECKHWKESLDQHDGQLFRYFGVSKAKFGILTNGIQYRFYSDIEAPNVMDSKPFLEVDLTDLKDNQIEELKKFHKSYFDIEAILSTASELKYMGELKAVIAKEFASPSPDLVRLWGKQVYQGVFTAKVSEQFAALIKKTVGNYINDIISDRLNAAIKDGEETTAPDAQPETQPEDTKSRVETTDEELQAYYIVKAILRGVEEPENIIYRDSVTRFSVFLKENKAVSVCSFWFNGKNKKIGFQAGGGKNDMYSIESIDDIWNYSDNIIAAVRKVKGEE